jgi:hypothetical protein
VDEGNYLNPKNTAQKRKWKSPKRHEMLGDLSQSVNGLDQSHGYTGYELCLVGWFKYLVTRWACKLYHRLT